MLRSLPQEAVHGRRTIRAAAAQRGVGELPQHCAAGRAETNGLSIDLAQEIVRHRHHDLRHAQSIPWYTEAAQLHPWRPRVLRSTTLGSHADMTPARPVSPDPLDCAHAAAPSQRGPLETLARETSYLTVPSGTAIIREGQQGDRYYAITRGDVAITKGSTPIARMGRGEGFGEIALLYPVTRTATVTAVTDTTLLSVERDAFLAALSAGAHVHDASIPGPSLK